ncbi:MAG: 1,4-alpha-glucan branching protein GlgB [Clostridiales bacterium]|nr:1,4-alpha-glucan branching protein GlgB [Clostridiales bacterium]
MAEKWAEQFRAGELTDGWHYFGAHPCEKDGMKGWNFCVWAPNARAVSVVGDFNGWEPGVNPLENELGIWQGFIPRLEQYAVYKFAIEAQDGTVRFKADPYAFHAETRPSNGSKLYGLKAFDWSDEEYIRSRKDRRLYDGPLNIYEVHIGSWKQRSNGDFFDYRSFGYEISKYVKEMGFNAVELMPITEYPLDDSWGYQVTGYFAPTSRYGTPEDAKWMIDYLHKEGIAVILDWVPSHFCKDGFGLIDFDGGSCYEYADPNKKEHASWGTRVFDFGRPEVISFLCSSARYWLEEFHVDGLRVDAVASMLYLDYDRPDGRWSPNKYGGKENIEAIEFLRKLNRMAFSVNPYVMMIAEESTAWPMVSKPVESGGLGFNFKWNMGWMNDMCHYLKMDPFFRKDNHNDITFSLMYAFSENFILPMSHDEVVHMKGSLVNKMPGAYENQLKCVRGFYSYMLTHPGKNMLFMGPEIGQWHEWDSKGQLDWYLLDNRLNRQLQTFFKEINRFYLESPELWEVDYEQSGFEWLVTDDTRNNMVVFLRKDKKGNDLLCAVNFSPNEISNYRVGVPERRRYVPVFNTDKEEFGGTGFGDTQPVKVERIESNGRNASVSIRIPAFSGVFFRGEGKLPKLRKKKTSSETAAAEKKSAVEKKASAKKEASAVKKAAGKKSAVEKKAAAGKKTAQGNIQENNTAGIV